MTRLILVRHGEADSNVSGVLGGAVGCTGLSPLGVRQAEALAERLRRTGELGPVAALYASTLPRAIETAELLAPVLGGLEVRVVHDLREWDPGEADGLTWEEFERDHPLPNGQWDAYANRAPGDESWAEFGLRAGRALHHLAEAHPDETVVVACHGGVIEQSVVTFLGLGFLGELATFHIANASITEWLRPDPHEEWWRPVGRWRLIRLNDAAHLFDLG